MTDSAEKMREAIKRFHRNCCYPEAFDFEVDGLMNELAALSASGTKSDGGGEVADPQKPEIGSVEFRGKKSLGALPGSCAPTADATALPSSDGVAPIPSDLKRGEIFSFDDGLLMIKMSGYGREDGWGTLAFHDSQIEIDADGFHCVEIAPSELREIRDFLNRVTKPGPSDPIPSQPDERPVCKLCGLEDGACICRSIPKQPKPDEVEAIKTALIAAGCDTGDGSYVHAAMVSVIAAILADPIPSQPDKVEAIAETIWRAEYRRATGRERSVPWSEVSSTDRERYRYVADNILAMLAERRGVKP